MTEPIVYAASDSSDYAEVNGGRITFYRDGNKRGDVQVEATGYTVTLPDGTTRFIAAQTMLAIAAETGPFSIADHLYGNCTPTRDIKPVSEWQPYADGPRDARDNAEYDGDTIADKYLDGDTDPIAEDMALMRIEMGYNGPR
jgi:hypothetical protein